jgi:uncharacterized protein
MEADTQADPQSDAFRLIASPWHTLAMLVVILIIAFRGKLHADQIRTIVNLDRISLYEHTILFEWLVLGLVLAGVWLHGSSLLTVLGNRWHSVSQFFQDIGIGLLFLIASILITSIIGPPSGADDKVTQFLLPHGGIERGFWIALSITAGFCEEAVYRGYLQKQFMALTRNAPAGIVLSALVFGAAHSYQGFSRAALIAAMGVMGGILAHWRRSVRPGMIAHALQDILGGFIRH